jgi:GR25 family glycosyltransferase involved in LPS biosynthesis
MEIHVISLSDKQSLTIVSDTYKSLKSKNIEFKKFDAINGYDIKNKDILDKYSKIIKVKKLNRRKGRKGCLASHLELLKKCSEGDKNYLILEQDVVLMDGLDINILNKCSKNCKDVVLLDPYNPYMSNYNKLVKRYVTIDKLKIINQIKNKIKSLKIKIKKNKKKN